MVKQFGRPSVIVVGAGPTGLALTIELGSRGIPCILLERSGRGGYAPRAKTTHVRTREILRRWGIADKLAEASPFGVDYPVDIHFVTRLGGHKLFHFPDALNCSPRRDERYSEHGQWIPQYKLEAVMRDHAATLDCVAIEFGREFLSFAQDERCVRAEVRRVDTGETYSIEADYLIGADGASSLVRDLIGAKMVGKYGLSRNYNIIFEAPGLAEAHSHGPGVMYWQVNLDCPSIMGPMDTPDIWYFMPTMMSGDAKLSDEDARDLIRKSTGIDLDYRILSSDEWMASALIADRYRLDRVFLAGDACHLHPPPGGFGMNMGVADGLDLGWKIAAVLQGWGGPTLLDSYEAERRPVHELVVKEAVSNHAILSNQLHEKGLEDDTVEGEAVRQAVSAVIRRVKEPEFYALGVVLGCRYIGSPIVAEEDGSADWKISTSYTPSAAPGSLAPHRWLSDDLSLYDEFGTGFTLLVLGDVEGIDLDRARMESEQSSIPLKIVVIDDPELACLYEARRILVRPDQFVAWRGDAWPSGQLLPFAAGMAASAP